MLDWRMHKFLSTAAVAALLLAGAAHGDEIYKWVDKDGKTHYSSNKDEANGAATSTMRTNPAPAIGSGPPPAAAAANMDVLQRRAPEPQPATTPPPPKPQVHDYRSESNATKCMLAQDILSGRAHLRNGEQIDAYARQTAESDVRLFCNK